MLAYITTPEPPVVKARCAHLSQPSPAVLPLDIDPPPSKNPGSAPAGVSWLDRVRNEVVRARTGVRRELAARVDVNVLRWFGHVERMDNE